MNKDTNIEGEEKLFTRNGIYLELRKHGHYITNTDVYRILASAEPDGMIKNNPAFTMATFLEAEKELAGGSDDPELAELIKKHKAEQITKLQIENSNKKKQLVDRAEVLEYLLSHQSNACNILKFYLLNKLPNTLKDAESRQLLLTTYNEAIDALRSSIIAWCDKTNQQIKSDRVISY